MANLVRLIKGVPIWLIFLSLSWASPLHVIPSADKGDSHDSGLHLSPASVLQSRASYDYSLAYESAVKKGKELECAMGLPAESAKDCFSKETSITSKFKDYSSLAENEWSMFLSGLDNSASWRPLQGPLKKLGISTDKKHWNWDRMAHRGKVSNESRAYRELRSKKSDIISLGRWSLRQPIQCHRWSYCSGGFRKSDLQSPSTGVISASIEQVVRCDVSGISEILPQG